MKNTKTKRTAKARSGSLKRVSDEEISNKRDDACESLIAATLVEDVKYKEGIRDALAWVLGDMEEGLEV